MNNLGQYRKAIAAFIAGLASFLIVVLPLWINGDVNAKTLPMKVTTTLALLAFWIGGAGAVHQLTNDVPTPQLNVADMTNPIVMQTATPEVPVEPPVTPVI